MKIDFPFRRRVAEGWVAVSLGEDRARFAFVKPGPRPAVVALEEREWDAADPKARERIIKSLRLSRYRCTTLIGQADYQMLLVETPNVKREEIKSAVRWKIKDMIDYPADAATVEVLEVPASLVPQRAPSLYAVVSKSEALRRLIERFEAARIELEVIDIADTAQRNIAALYETPERALLTLSFDPDGGLITITSGAELYVSRRLDLPYAQVTGAPPARERAFGRVVIEVQRSLDHFERNFGQLSLDRVLLAPMPQADDLVAHLASQLQPSVAAIDLADVMDLPPVYLAAPPEVRAPWFRLIGAALRVEGKPA